MKDLTAVSTIVASVLGPDLIQVEQKNQELTLHIYAGAIVRSLIIMRDHPDLLFKVLLDICAVDYPEQEQRFQVVYHLLMCIITADFV